MRKVFLLVGLSFIVCKSPAQNRWDRPMQLKSCSIDIKADMFSATTFVELEFCNPNKQEIEGLFRFALKPGQIITAFQLDLHGKYRDGSIEEKWKATNAYNTIVGKRIDPALLTMEYADNYSLRIYPVPGNGCRKVTFTIQQALRADKNELLYTLPLNINDTVRNFKLDISVNGTKPIVRQGLILSQIFKAQNDKHNLTWSTDNIQLNKEISFSIPLSSSPWFCTKTAQDTKHYAIRFQPSFSNEYDLHPRKLAVYWDASASTERRDLTREISFLKQFISYHNIAELTIIPFNSKLLDTAVFYTEYNFNSRWDHYLENIKYDGATQFGCIDLTAASADLYMIFTDGNNTYGKSLPKTARGIVHCVYNSNTADPETLKKITGASGGKIINLNKSSISTAIMNSSKAETWLVKISSSSGKVITEQTLPIKRSSSILINGTMPLSTDSLFLHYGNNTGIKNTEHFMLDAGLECPESGIDRLTMLHNYDWITKNYQWSYVIDFGLTEKVVTQNTAYIVLERIEDYVKYNITPPKELEEECEKLNYVRKDTRSERMKMMESSEFNIVNNVANIYNSRIRNLDPNSKLITLDRDKFEDSKRKNLLDERIGIQMNSGAEEMKFSFRPDNAFGLSEVVVTGLGMSRQSRSLAYSVATIRSNDIPPSATSVEQVLQGKVAGLQITTNQSAFNGDLTLSGISSFGGNNPPLYVLDGIPVSGNINNLINVHDIENISVLKNASAAAIYGSRGANGVIVINSKKGSNVYNSYNHRPYRLKDMEDVEYMQELKLAAPKQKMKEYERLRDEFGGDAGFYFDVAQHLFESGSANDAYNVLMNAAEASNGSQEVLVAIAYVLEKWKKFDEAVMVYEQLLIENHFNLNFRQDLAWLYYQKGDRQKAVDILYNAIGMNTGQMESVNMYFKSVLLNDLNIIISMHKNEIVADHIPTAIINPLEIDMRILMECNRGFVNFSVIEPGDVTASYSNLKTKNGGIFTYNYYWHNYHPSEYQIKNAPAGKYKIMVTYHTTPTDDRIPSMIRLRTFKNFGRPNQSINIENIIMDNQQGTVEIGEVKW